MDVPKRIQKVLTFCFIRVQASDCSPDWDVELGWLWQLAERCHQI